MGKASRFLTFGGAEDALARRAKGLDRLITPGLWLAVGLLAAGVYLPIMSVAQFFIFTDRVSIWTAVQDLLEQRELFLAAVIFLFTILFPCVKISVAYGLWRKADFDPRRHRRAVAVLEAIGRWSLTDVLVVAILIVIAKSTSLASAQADVGLYFFASSVLLTSLLVHRIKRNVALATAE